MRSTVSGRFERCGSRSADCIRVPEKQMIFRFVPILAVSVRDSVGFLGTASVFFASTARGVTVVGAMTEQIV
jgi:hypothetical protein